MRVAVDGEDQLWDRTGYGTLISTGAGDNYVHNPGGGILCDNDSWLHGDAVGSVRYSTDPTGAVNGAAAFTVFGEPRIAGTSQFGFAGEQTDPTGLIHLRARGYNPTLGTFTAYDPVQPGGPSTAGWNHYTYTANNPTTWWDPTGTISLPTYQQLIDAAGDKIVPIASVVGLATGGIVGLIGCGGLNPTVTEAEYQLCIGLATICTSAGFAIGATRSAVAAIGLGPVLGTACGPFGVLAAGGDLGSGDVSTTVVALGVSLEAAAAGWLDLQYKLKYKKPTRDVTTFILDGIAVAAFTAVVAAISARIVNAVDRSLTPPSVAGGERPLPETSE